MFSHDIKCQFVFWLAYCVCDFYEKYVQKCSGFFWGGGCHVYRCPSWTRFILNQNQLKMCQASSCMRSLIGISSLIFRLHFVLGQLGICYRMRYRPTCHKTIHVLSFFPVFYVRTALNGEAFQMSTGLCSHEYFTAPWLILLTSTASSRPQSRQLQN